MTKLYRKEGGLMEDPDWHWEVIGDAPGTTTREVADNLALTDTEFARDYNPEKLTSWGWGLATDIGEFEREAEVRKKKRASETKAYTGEAIYSIGLIGVNTDAGKGEGSPWSWGSNGRN